MRSRKPPDEKTPQGTPTQPGQGEGGDAPKYVTEEQLNRAISARLADYGKKVEKSIEAAVGGIGAKLDELKSSLPSLGGGGTDSKDPPRGGDIENHPLVKGLQKQIADQKAATEQLKAERDAEKAAARDGKLRQKLTDALTKGGVDPRYVRKAVGDLVDVEKRVRFSDDEGDDLVFRDATGDLDLETGLKGWFKSDDAKIYLPPRGTQGSGDRAGTRASQGGQTPSIGGALLGMAARALGGDANQQG